RIQCKRRRSVWTHIRSTDWWERIVGNFTDAQWLNNFRMSQETFEYLCQRLAPTLQRSATKFRLCVPVHKRVAIALWKLATNSDYRSVGHLFGVSKATVCSCVQEFCMAVTKILLQEHMAVPSAEQFAEMSDYFDRRWGVPQCVGAIDGSHIPIIAPQHYHCDYFNRKGWHSIILQAVVDGKGHFWDLNVGFPGSVHDARVLKNSTLWTLASSNRLFPNIIRNISGCDVGYYILGDPAYPLQRWLMKPFSDTGRLSEQQRQYNYRVSRARSVVENAFGRLKGRWRCLLKRNDCDVNLVKRMVLTCCMLHNICEKHGEYYSDDWAATLELAQPVHVLPERGVNEGAAD
ncbi:protein ANTAGONIST OF LIKE HETEROCHROMATIN PROTEIN 1-like, partial [Huso huso]